MLNLYMIVVLKKTQDIFILLWKLTKLNLKTKNWLCVTNYNEIHDDFPTIHLLINFGEYVSKISRYYGQWSLMKTGHKIVLR